MEEWKIFGSCEISSLGRVKKKGRIISVAVDLSRDNNKYPRIRVDGKYWKIHKLMQAAFELGDGFVDHIDGNRNNNALTNLRVVSARQNACNSKRHRNGNLVGASYRKNNKKWQSSIYLNGKYVYLGLFETDILAHEAYLKALSEHMADPSPHTIHQ